jgi:hypothetical protein
VSKFSDGEWETMVGPDQGGMCFEAGYGVYCGGTRVAHVFCSQRFADKQGEGVAEANANLIAAAPEMYKAMTEFVHRCEIGEVRSVKTYAGFKAILAKADGT